MSISSFHVHCRFCDGYGEPEEYVRQAIETGFPVLGFSSHAPIPYENPWTMKEGQIEAYCHTIRELKEKYQGQIEIYLGLEVDYLPGIMGPGSPRFKALGLDYTIGSIHFVDCGPDGPYVSVDGSQEEYAHLLQQVYEGDIQGMVGDYYRRMREMVTVDRPDIIGHLDIIKKNNTDDRYFSEAAEWYRKEVLDTLQVIAHAGVIVEVNTGGIARKYVNDLYPSSWILAECRRMNIPIMLNSDSHHPQTITAYYDGAIQRLKALGFYEQRILLGQKWTTVPLG